MPNAPTIKFDFRYYIPNQDLSDSYVVLDRAVCAGESFVVSVLAENLIPGHLYKTEYELISPETENSVFNPAVASLYASYGTQSFITTARLPEGANPVNSYVLKATVTDITDETTSSVQASTQITLVCGIARPVFRPEILDPDLQPIPPDNIIDLQNCDNSFPIVCVIKDAIPGKLYEYEFFGNPSDGIVFENKTGSVYAGDVNQNFNAKVNLTTYPYVFVHSTVKEKDTNITRSSQTVLLKCFQTNECDVILPTGVNVSVDVPTFKRCANRGLTDNSISLLYGGKGFSIGDTLTATGGGGYGSEIQLLSGGITQETFSSFVGGSGFNIGDLVEVTGGGGSGGLIRIASGGLTNASISSLVGCSNFKVGDLLTTIGGGGSDALISVTSTGVNGSISGYSVINPGYGYTNVPSGVKTISGSGSCVSATFDGNNFTIPCVGSISYSSSNIRGGSAYNIGEVLDVVGGGGSGAQIKVLTGSLTAASISVSGGSNYAVGDYLSTLGGGGVGSIITVATTGTNGSISSVSIANEGYGFVSAPTGLITVTGSGTNAVFSGNANNFSITSNGSITKDSITGLVNSGIGYSVGDKLIVAGGAGSGGLIEVISVNNNGQILDFIVKNGGSGYSSAPQLINEDQILVSNQPLWNISNFTKNSYAIINGGCSYAANPSSLISNNGDGTGANFTFDESKFSKYAYTVVNTGSGYTDAPTGIVVRSGNGSGITITFNDENFTIPCVGGITYESISGLIGKSAFLDGQELVVDGGGGSGGRIRVTGVSNLGAITSFVVLDAGCGYVSEPSLKTIFGTIVSGVSFDTEGFTDYAVIITNPGYGFVDVPTGLQVVTGTADISNIFVQFNKDNFVEIIGPDPTPSSTPTPTVTPSTSVPAQCDDLQTSGGQNTTSNTLLAVNALNGQNFIIVADTAGLRQYSVLEADGIPAGTHIVQVENFFANFDQRKLYKKLTLSSNLASDIAKDTDIKVYSTDIRIIKVPYWPGNMNFLYDAYNVPDRFKVYAVPTDARLPDVLLFDSGYRGALPCGYAPSISGPGSGSVQLSKPDGCTFIKVVVEAPCAGTAWEYSLSCPQRVYTTITQTPTPTLTKTPTPTPSSTQP